MRWSKIILLGTNHSRPGAV